MHRHTVAADPVLLRAQLMRCRFGGVWSPMLLNLRGLKSSMVFPLSPRIARIPLGDGHSAWTLRPRVTAQEIRTQPLLVPRGQIVHAAHRHAAALHPAGACRDGGAQAAGRGRVAQRRRVLGCQRDLSSAHQPRLLCCAAAAPPNTVAFTPVRHELPTVERAVSALAGACR